MLGLAQSGVSRHLGLLKDAGLVAEERDGGFTYYRRAAALRTARTASARCGRCCEAQFERAGRDRRGARRRCAAAGSAARCGRRTSRRTPVPTRATRASSCPAAAGRRGRARSACCCRRLRVADLGCGEGYLTIEAGALGVAGHRRRSVRRRCSKRARALARAAASTNVIWKRGELEKLPLQRRQRRRRDAVAGAAPRRSDPARARRRSRAHHRRRAAAC